MNTLLASHTMPSADEMVGVPALLFAALVATALVLVAGYLGVRSAASLELRRRLEALAPGLALGGLVVAGVGLSAVALFGQVGGSLIVLTAGAASGAATAYAAARAAGVRLSWYTCEACGLPFHSRVRAQRCPACEARRDQEEVARALADFTTRYRELP
jgi:hypothetical protein